MSEKWSAYAGCFLGLAVGDAMGLAVDDKTWDEICAAYGPNGLLGYDLLNGCAEVTSYTQVAAYVANALLVANSRGKTDGYIRYITLALREWAKRQHFPRLPEKSPLWVSQLPQLRRKACRDARMLDALRMETLGTMQVPINSASSPGAMPVAAAIALFFEPERMEPAQVGTLAAESLALTHGNPEVFLSGVVLAYSIAGILHQPECALKEQFVQANAAMQAQFGSLFPQQSQAVAQRVNAAIRLAADKEAQPRQCMERLGCYTCAECLAGAVYACLKSSEDFDSAMILAVNHSGLSCATGAITGAIIGAYLGCEALPDFYLESLEAKEPLEQLAKDLTMGALTAGLFDDDWDQRYVQGIPTM